MLLSMCVVLVPLNDIASGFGLNGAVDNDPNTTPVWRLIGSLFIFIFGVTGVFTGYMATVHDYSHKNLNMFLMVMIQTAWISYITEMVVIGEASRHSVEKNIFIPLAYEPTDSDVQFMGAVGIISLMMYAFAFIGSMSFMVWSLHSYTTNDPGIHCGSYFKGRMTFYSAVLAVAGFMQFLLGCYLESRFNTNTAENDVIAVSVFVVSFPEISIYVGLLQMINGVWGVARSFDMCMMKDMDMQVFQYSMGFQWLNVLILQIVVQVSYLTGDLKANLAPILAALSLGLNLMPAYLDHKMNTMPETMPDDYYGEMVAVQEMAKDKKEEEEVVEQDA
jgi:hypothetical protein